MREELFDVSGVGAVERDMERMVSSCVRVKQLFLRLRQLGLGSEVFRVLWAPYIIENIFCSNIRGFKIFVE